MSLKVRARQLRSLAPVALALCMMAQPSYAQDQPPQPAIETSETAQAPNSPVDRPSPEKHESKLHQMFFDEEDGRFDLSRSLSRGGFVPMPIIITEPAVDGGFGIAAQFVKMDKDNPRQVTRTIVAALKTGNGSYGYGAFRTGYAFDGRMKYKIGAARGKVNLEAHPAFLPSGVNYTNTYDYGVLGSVMWRLPDDRFSVGPLIDFRQLTSKIDIQGLPEEFNRDFGRKMNTGALGLGFHFDSRDNPVSPTQGVNAFIEGKFNSDTFGSDRNYQTYDLDVYAFHRLSPKWNLGFKTEIDAARGSFPSYFAPSIDLRGVESIRYQGSTVQSSEVELVMRLGERWSILAFGGVGSAYAGQSRVFDNSGAIFAGGAGFRYRIARKLGIDLGIDVAAGPGGGIFYIQFGHAWGFGMD